MIIQPYFLLMRWLQMLPLALLCFAPFGDEELLWGRRRGYLAATAYVVLSSVAMALISPLFSVNGQRNIIARDAVLVVVTSVFFYGWSRLVCTSGVRKLLVGAILLHYDLALQSVSDVLAAFVLEERYVAEVNAEAGSLTLDLCILVANMVTWPLVWVFCHRVLRKSLPALDDRDAARGLGYMFLIAVVFVVAIYNPRYEIKPEVPLFVVALIATDMVAYYIFFQEIGAVRRQAETARQLSDYQMQYQQIVSRMETVRRLRHDVRHHLNTLGALNAQGRTEDITEYLRQYGKVFEQLEDGYICGDPAVDSVLGYYRAQAAEEGAGLEYSVLLQGPSGVEHMDMTVLLGNSLENALEALRLLPEGERRLSVKLQPAGAMLLLQVANSCGPGEDTGFAGWEAFPSGKKAGRSGVGLRSITEIAEKYGGSARFQRKGGSFTAQVSLCVNPDAKEEGGV